MPFYITRALASGPIRLGVGERNTTPDADGDGEIFSTGPAGEYLPRRAESHFFSDAAPAHGRGAGVLRGVQRERTVPLWGWVSIGFGGLLILLGILVVVNKGYRSGYVEAAVGVALIALPFIVTAAKRAEVRRRVARERAEREAEEARLKEAAGGYAAAVARLRSARQEDVLREIRAAREGKDLPPEVIAQTGKPAALRAGFEALTRWEEEGAEGVAKAIRRTAEAVGLTPEDEAAVGLAVTQKAWWHLLADDRLTEDRRRNIQTLSRALGLDGSALAAEQRASEQFDRLRGIGPRNLPRIDPTMRLRALETCLHTTRGSVTAPRREVRIGKRIFVEGGWKEGSEEDVVLTSQRILVRGGKTLDLDVRSIRELEIDMDRGVLAIVVKEDREKVHYLRLPDPIYAAGLLDAAAAAPVKPKGLV